MRDPYEVLGLQRGASAADIKKAYRRLAKKLHPDANTTDPKAAARFAELNSAYEIVGDDDKRKAFDSGAIDAEGKPRFQGFEGFGGGSQARARRAPGGPGFESFSFGPEGFQRGAAGGAAGGFGFEDVLSSVFGRMGRGGGNAARVDFGQAAGEDFGTATAGRDAAVEVTITLAEATRGTQRRVQLPTGKHLEVKVPAGLSDGQQIRLKGQGWPGSSPAHAGDALVTVRVAPDSRFKQEGAHLRVEVPVTLYEAVLGGKVRVPTLDGAVDLAIPPRSNGGRTFRLKGKGLATKSGPGDLLVSIRITLPERSDPDFEALMQTWRDQNPYDPRAGGE